MDKSIDRFSNSSLRGDRSEKTVKKTGFGNATKIAAQKVANLVNPYKMRLTPKTASAGIRG